MLPPIIVFCAPGMPYLIPRQNLIDTFICVGDNHLLEQPVLGQGSVNWNDVFAQIKQPQPVWDTWKPSKPPDQMSIQDVWDCYNVGEAAEENGRQTGVTPPLWLVKQKFGAEWWKTGKVRLFCMIKSAKKTDMSLGQKVLGQHYQILTRPLENNQR